MMWTVIYIAQSEKLAEGIKDRLMQEGFLPRVRAVGQVKRQYEILIPQTELEEVQEVLNEVLQFTHP